MRESEQQDIQGTVRVQVIEDRVHPLGARWKPGVDLVEKVHPICRGAASIGDREGGARRRLEGSEDVAFTPPPIVDFLAGAGSPAHLGGWGRHYLAPAETLRCFGPEFVQADDRAAWWRLGI